MIARTAGKLRRAVVLGGRAVFPAAVGLALTTPGAAWTARAAGDGAWGGPNRSASPVITTPVDGSEFRVGVPLTLSAEPGPGKAKGGDDLHWIVIRHTGAGAEAVDEEVGTHATFTPSDRLGADTSYEIVLTSGEGGRDGISQSVTIVPETVELTLGSDPGGVALSWGESASADQRTVKEPVGRRIALSAPTTSSPSGGGELVFDSWSDGGAREREYVVPETPAVLIARYRAPAIDIGDALRLSGSAPRIEIGDALRIEGTTPASPEDSARTLSGSVRGGARGVRIEIAIRRGDARTGCAWLRAGAARFSPARRAACGRPRWMRASARRTRAGWSWKLTLSRPLEGRHTALVRVVDARGRTVATQRG